MINIVTDSSKQSGAQSRLFVAETRVGVSRAIRWNMSMTDARTRHWANKKEESLFPKNQHIACAGECSTNDPQPILHRAGTLTNNAPVARARVNRHPVVGSGEIAS